MVSVNTLRRRKADFSPNRWLMDSGAFSVIAAGRDHMPVEEYARHVERWSRCGTLEAAVAQDFMCEPFVLEITGMTVVDHQRLTIERYQLLRKMVDTVYIMPVLQGYSPTEYQRHVRDYGATLGTEAWVGVGSVCKRNGRPGAVVAIHEAIKDERPDLRLHGFGLKRTALRLGRVNELLHSSDSMAWSFQARKQGRGANDIREAHRYVDALARQQVQRSF